MTATRHRDMRQIVRNSDGGNDPAQHQCAVLNCQRFTLLGYVACRVHWLALPRDTRQILAEAFRQRLSRPDLYNEAVHIASRLVNVQAGTG